MNNYREPQMNIRVYLNVPYNDKDRAKELGCRWDSDMKKWYCIDSDYGKSKITECVKLWNKPEPYKLIDGKKILISDIPKHNRGFSVMN